MRRHGNLWCGLEMDGNATALRLTSTGVRIIGLPCAALFVGRQQGEILSATSPRFSKDYDFLVAGFAVSGVAGLSVGGLQTLQGE